jgi:acetyl esterase/lipase
MFEDRLDPALRQFAAARTDLSASVLGVVRDSLNQRRADASRDVNTVGVEIENREAQSIPVRVYRGGAAPAPAVIYCHSGLSCWAISTPITASVWSSRDAAAAR